MLKYGNYGTMFRIVSALIRSHHRNETYVSTLYVYVYLLIINYKVIRTISTIRQVIIPCLLAKYVIFLIFWKMIRTMILFKISGGTKMVFDRKFINYS